jgi:N-acetylneuraminic acid mutarotase
MNDTMRKTPYAASALYALAALMSSLPAHAGWTTLTAMPEQEQGAAVAAIDGIVYVAGGFKGANLAALQAYNPTTNSWTTLASMPDARYTGNGAGVINSQLYVAGGWTQNPPLPNNTLFVYDPPTDSWATMASMAHLSGCGATGVIDGKLYVTTACNGFSGFTNFLDAYDPATDSWMSLAGSASPHSQPAAGVINDKFYVAGGVGVKGGSNVTTNLLEVYDAAKNKWTTLAPMPLGVVNPASAVLNGRLYVFGGQPRAGLTSNLIQVYDPHTNHWTTTTMPIARSGAGAVEVYGIAFVAGGVTSSGAFAINQDLIVTPSIP